jgi:hypothetical protein
MHAERIANSLFRHPRKSLPGIHPRETSLPLTPDASPLTPDALTASHDGCPIKNVGHDAGEWKYPIHDVGNDRAGDGFPIYVIRKETKDLAEPWGLSAWAQILRHWFRMTGWVRASAITKCFLQCLTGEAQAFDKDSTISRR